jgi:hypothetical protein
VRKVVVLVTVCMAGLLTLPAGAGTLYVAHGGGSSGAAEGGVIGVIDTDTYAYSALTGSLGSLTSLIYTGLSLYTFEAQGKNFLEVDPVTGQVLNAVAKTGGNDPTDMAWDSTTGTAYAVGTDYQLYTVNLTTGQMSVVGPVATTGGFVAIAFAPDGRLFAHATNAPGEVDILDKTTAGTLSVIPGGVPGGALGLVYDSVSGLLYASECCSGTDGALGERLFSVDPVTGSAVMLFDYDDGRRMQDFAFVGGAPPVPEPGTLVMVGLAIGALAVVRRQRAA